MAHTHLHLKACAAQFDDSEGRQCLGQLIEQRQALVLFPVHGHLL